MQQRILTTSMDPLIYLLVNRSRPQAWRLVQTLQFMVLTLELTSKPCHVFGIQTTTDRPHRSPRLRTSNLKTALFRRLFHSRLKDSSQISRAIWLASWMPLLHLSVRALLGPMALFSAAPFFLRIVHLATTAGGQVSLTTITRTTTETLRSRKFLTLQRSICPALVSKIHPSTSIHSTN